MKHGIKMLVACVLGASIVSTCAYALDNPQAPDNQAVETKNQIDGNAFLTANKKKPGVVALPSGLQYKIITEGKGAKPHDADTVTVDYAGTLVNGTEFDSSYKRGQPATFQVSAVIPGWTEALKLMPTGSTWEVYIPSALAYGDQGAPPIIGPNEVLIFKIHLINIEKQKATG